MTSHSSNDSTLQGKFSEIMNFLMGAEGDETDQLARRAVSVILATNRPQTGEEADTDPFVANMFACAALTSISENIKHYPFVRDTRVPLGYNESGSISGFDPDVLGSARSLIERAEALLPATSPFLQDADFFVTENGGTDLSALEELFQSLIERAAPRGFDGFVLIIIDDEAEEPLQ
jgi:hypothetical protein